LDVPVDPNEVLRLQALAELEVDTLMSDPAIDRITASARERFGVPICLVTIIEAQRQVLLSRQGLDVTETPRSLSFCTYAILKPQVLVVPDARVDERFRTNPLVTGEPFVRFYAGAPLTYRNEVRLGALCMIDYEPRTLSEHEQAELMRLADQVVSIIVARATGRADAPTDGTPGH
jgi:GAF domain-containing protein